MTGVENVVATDCKDSNAASVGSNATMAEIESEQLLPTSVKTISSGHSDPGSGPCLPSDDEDVRIIRARRQTTSGTSPLDVVHEPSRRIGH